MDIGIQAATRTDNLYTFTVCDNWGVPPSGGAAGCLCKSPAEMTQHHHDFHRDGGRVPESQRGQYEEQFADGALTEAATALSAQLPLAQRLVGRSRTLPGAGR